jgi:MFS transporter, OPA family, glycerol-3-phosphate transporter
MSMQPNAASDQNAAQSNEQQPDHTLHRHPGELLTVWVLWLVYGAFYFCRTNLSAAIPGIEKSLGEGGLGLTGSEIGRIQGSAKLTYGVGQLLNGQMAEHVSPRKLLAFGMLGSSVLNQLFGLSAAYYTLLFIWAANGYFQSLGWAPCIRVVGNWIPPQRRGKAIGIIGTGYQVTLGLTYIVAGTSAQYLGWRGALQIPSILLAATAVFMLFFLKDSPEATVRDVSSSAAKKAGGKWLAILQTIGLTLTNPALWLLGISLGLLNACRYGFVDWGIAHLIDVQDTRIDKAALNYGVLALGAVAGSYLTGMATDRFFGGRRAPAICFLLILLSILTLLYERVAQTSATATIFLLLFIGFCIYGPQVLLVGTAPADLARRGTPAAAAGFVNFLGYMGAALGDVVTGHYKMEEHGGWKVAIYIWAGWALAAAFFAALLWNAKPKKEDQTVSQ